VYWFVAEDRKYYRDFKEILREGRRRGKRYSSFEEILQKGKEFEKGILWEEGKRVFLVFPERSDEISSWIRKGYDVDVLSLRFPKEGLREFFVVEYLENEGGVFTSQELEYMKGLLSEEKREEYRKKKIEEKLGLRIYLPKVREDDVVGMAGVKRFVYRVAGIKDRRFKAKGVFLVGVPGTGKSFSAKYVAGVLGWYLVEINISKIMETDNPVWTLHRVFKFLEDLSEREESGGEGRGFVLWVDEIEKMFTGGGGIEKRLFGQLLTILNDMNTETGYKIKGIFWVTANNIVEIAENNPEFLRKGRFDELFFVDTPQLEDAKKVFRLYQRKFGVRYIGTGLRESFQVEVLDAEKRGVRIEYGGKGKDRWLAKWLEGRRSIWEGEFGEEGVKFVQMVYQEEARKYGAKSVDRFLYTPAEIEGVVKELGIRQRIKLEILRDMKIAERKRRQGENLLKMKRKGGKSLLVEAEKIEKEIEEKLKLLYPERVWSEVRGIIEKYYGVKGKGASLKYKNFLDWVRWELKRIFFFLRRVINTVDLIFVIKLNDPLALRLKDPISQMRSQEKFFMPADR